MSETKSLPITKQMVWNAYRKVKANQGSAGVDEVSLKEYAANLTNNLYKLWNRLASGSYFPPPVKEVAIPKQGGKMRKLGIPTVEDRIAQMVIKDYLEPRLEAVFHADSYGYRPGKSAHQALEKACTACREYDMVIDLDIQSFFDEIDHELLMKALHRHTPEKWVRMYVERWLKAPVRRADGTVMERQKGTPQGGVVSPLLANLFLHYCFDKWMEKEFADQPFERYADDIIVHCRTPKQAEYLLWRIKQRLQECKLQLHPQKTKVVYCRDSNRYKRSHPLVSFTFLGFTFQPRQCRSKIGKYFYSFTPAISRQALVRINDHIRGLAIHRMSESTLEDVASLLNAKLRGWINYYGRYRKSALWPLFHNLNNRLHKWVRWKYKQYRKKGFGAIRWLKRKAQQAPNLFVHWQQGYAP
jgi:RNA-directed DNA polymerase